VLETRQGNFRLAVALGVVLLLVALGINWLFTRVQQRGRA